MAAQEQQCKTTSAIAPELQQQHRLKINFGTMRGSRHGYNLCHFVAVLSLLCIVWHTVCCVEIAARRRVRLPSGVSFLCGKFCVSLVDLANHVVSVALKHFTTVVLRSSIYNRGPRQLGRRRSIVFYFLFFFEGEIFIT